MTIPERPVSIESLAAELNMKPNSVRTLVKTGRLGAICVPLGPRKSVTRITPDAIRDFLREYSRGSESHA